MQICAISKGGYHCTDTRRKGKYYQILAYLSFHFPLMSLCLIRLNLANSVYGKSLVSSSSPKLGKCKLVYSVKRNNQKKGNY